MRRPSLQDERGKWARWRCHHRVTCPTEWKHMIAERPLTPDSDSARPPGRGHCIPDSVTATLFLRRRPCGRHCAEVVCFDDEAMLLSCLV